MPLTSPTSAGSTGAAVLPAGAVLLCRRPYEGVRRHDVPLPARGFLRHGARRWTVTGVAHRLRHTRALLRPCRTPLRRARRGRRRPDGAAALGPVSASAAPPQSGDRRGRRAIACPGHEPVPDSVFRAGPCGRRLRALQHLRRLPLRLGAKGDAETCLIDPVLQHGNVALRTEALVVRLLADASGRRIGEQASWPTARKSGAISSYWLRAPSTVLRSCFAPSTRSTRAASPIRPERSGATT